MNFGAIAMRASARRPEAPCSRLAWIEPLPQHADQEIGVPPTPAKSVAVCGCTHRWSIDRHSDGTLDGDIAVPTLRVATAGPNIVISWPTDGSGSVLETATNLSPSAWRTETSLRHFIGSEIQINTVLSRASGPCFLRGCRFEVAQAADPSCQFSLLDEKNGGYCHSHER